MKLLFCYDGPLRKDEYGNYYGIALHDDVLKRYECISNDISIAIRVRSISKELTNKMMPINSNKYKVNELPNLSSIRGIFNRKKCYTKLKRLINDNDLIIVR